MAIQTFSGMSAMPIPSYPRISGNAVFTNAANTLDAAGEAVHFIGQLWLESGAGSKTISAAGSGKIGWRTSGTVTFANAGTTLSVGLQDVDTAAGPAARGDATFDVSADLVGGTDTLAASTWHMTVMESGTKTIAHGDMIAIVLTMVSRAGADTVGISAVTSSYPSSPTVVLEAPAATYTIQTQIPNALIEFDDGTLGFIRGSFIYSAVPATLTFSSSSTPDEVCAIINVPFAVQVDGFWGVIGATAATNDYELILYSDALGTPDIERTVVVDANQRSSATIRYGEHAFAPFTMLANTDYAVALRPTTTGTVSLEQFTVSVAAHMKAHSLGTSCYKGTRTNQTGAFTADTLNRLSLGVMLCGVEDGAGAGGMSVHPGMSGGFRG